MINQILAPFDGVLVVYSGGDDLFFVGGWRELLQAAVQLRRAFAQYTDNALTFSAGFSLYTPRYPIARAALETTQLEDFAKELPNKNAITLFAEEESLRFDWPTFEAKVQEKGLIYLERIAEAFYPRERTSPFCTRKCKEVIFSKARRFCVIKNWQRFFGRRCQFLLHLRASTNKKFFGVIKLGVLFCPILKIESKILGC